MENGGTSSKSGKERKKNEKGKEDRMGKIKARASVWCESEGRPPLLTTEERGRAKTSPLPVQRVFDLISLIGQIRWARSTRR